MLRNYLLVALRNIWRQKFFSAVNVIGLALGMAICMLPIMKIKEAFDFDTFHPFPDRTFRITTQVSYKNGDKTLFASTPFALADHLADNYPQIAHRARVVIEWADVKGGDVTQTMRGIYADNDFYKLFGFQVNGAPGGHGTIVLTRQASKRLFGNLDPVNKVVKIDQVGEMVVAGVMSDPPAPSHLQFEFVADIAAYMASHEKIQSDLQNEFGAYTYVSMEPGNDEQVLNEMLESSSTYVNNTVLSHEAKRFTFKHQRLDRISPGLTPIHNTTAEPVLPNLLILVLIGAVMLVLAIINYVNLSVAGTMTRAREVGVRKMAGAFETPGSHSVSLRVGDPRDHGIYNCTGHFHIYIGAANCISFCR